MSNGTSYIYDNRSTNQFLSEVKSTEDITPIISVIPFKQNEEFKNGGFFVVHLRTILFYEYKENGETDGTRLNVTGPFISVTYDNKTEMLLIVTRPNTEHPHSRYILGKLLKLDSVIVVEEIASFKGSQNQFPAMTRSSQISIMDTCLVASYMQDNQTLQTWSRDHGKLQSIPVVDMVTDTCPIYLDNGNTFLAALSSNKCRIYKVTPS